MGLSPRGLPGRAQQPAPPRAPGDQGQEVLSPTGGEQSRGLLGRTSHGAWFIIFGPPLAKEPTSSSLWGRVLGLRFRKRPRRGARRLLHPTTKRGGPWGSQQSQTPSPHPARPRAPPYPFGAITSPSPWERKGGRSRDGLVLVSRRLERAVATMKASHMKTIRLNYVQSQQTS